MHPAASPIGTAAPPPLILAVDDHVDNLRLLLFLLEPCGYRINIATDGSEALTSAAADPPDLILLDVLMPDMGGLEVCHRLKADPRLQAIPVVFLTALQSGVDKAAGFAAGGADYITKPFIKEELLARIEHQLELRRLQRALEARLDEQERRLADVTEAGRTAQERLRLAEFALDRMSTQVILAAPDGRLQGANRAACRRLGYREEELLRLRMEEIEPPGASDPWPLFWERLKKAGALTLEGRHRTRDGETYPVLIHANHLIYEGREYSFALVEDLSCLRRLEEEVLENERRYRRLVEETDAIVWEADPDDFRFTYVSPQAERILGFPLAAWLTPGFWTDRLHPTDRNQAVTFCTDATTQGLDHELTYRLLARDGRVVWIEDLVSVRTDPATGRRTLNGIMVDITERRRAETQLDRFFELAPDLLCIATPEGRFLRLSKAWEWTLGWSREELCARPFLTFVHPEDVTATQDAMEQLRAGQPIPRFVNRYRCKQGGWRWLEWISMPGEDRAIYAIGRDITDPIQTQRELESSHRRLRILNEVARATSGTLDLDRVLPLAQQAILDQLPIDASGIYLLDDDGAQLVLHSWLNLPTFYVRAAHEVRVGQGLTGRALAERRPIQQRVEEYPEDAPARRVNEEVGLRTLLSVPILVGDTPLGAINLASRDPAGFDAAEVELVGTIAQQLGIVIQNARYVNALNQELALRTRIEAQLREAKQAAEAASRAKSGFLANMSHELRTPMTSILGFTQLLARDPDLNALQRERLATIGRSGDHLLALINDVLDMSKIEAGRITLDLAPFDLHHALGTLAEMARLRAEAKGLRFDLVIAPDLPHHIQGDERKLRQVLMNLLSNAIKFTNEGGVRLHAAPCTEAASDRPQRLAFSVIDTGVGLAPDEVAQLFDAFTQTQAGRNTQEGTGLGLAISREFVRLMGGDIRVEPAPKGGACFRFDIQAHPLDLDQVAHAFPNRALHVLGLAPGQPECRILVADDQADSRLLLRELLEGAGFRVAEAANGREALERYASWQPHLIWMDMRMPEMDGLEATRKIRALPGGDAVCIIAFSATPFVENRNQVMAAGCDDFLPKPFLANDLFEMIRMHLGVKFRYGDDTHPGGAAPAAPLTAEGLAHLSPGLIDDLERVALTGDLDATDDILDRIGGIDPQLAATLDAWLDAFDYEGILQVIRALPGRDPVD